MKPIFYPYKMYSTSAKLLAKEFGAERVKPDGKFQNNYKRPIINWGNSERPWWMDNWQNQIVLNHPIKVADSCNKLMSFQKFREHNVACSEWTTDIGTAGDWISDGFDVVVRKTLTGKGGQGIVVIQFDPENDNIVDNLPDAPLYTKYFKRKDEYRVHVFNGKAIDFVQKKRSTPEADNQIRNHGKGWVFAREGIILPQCVEREALKAVAALGLTFGAVDVGHNVKKDLACVFEVNSAPGLVGTTITKYKDAITEFLK